MTKKKAKPKKKNNYPTVSVCTPTFNRRPFIPYMIKCFDSQDYPKDKIEWIIIDDGTDLIEDLVKDHPSVKYFKYDTKMTLGKKRNIMHDKSSGEILVYMDDDDYYPPTRISHAVKTLQNNSEALCAGSSEIYIYYKNIEKMYQFGPYGPNHSTAGTFAFKRKLLHLTRYNENASLAEEKEFLKEYTIPFVQLNPLDTILVFSHNHNTFDKRKLLEDISGNPFIKVSDKIVNDFVKNEEVKKFFLLDIDEQLKQYEPGKPEMKPDVIEQMKSIEKKRLEIINKRKEKNNEHEENSKRLFELQREKIKELTEFKNEIINKIQKITVENVQKDSQIRKLKEELISKNKEHLINNNFSSCSIFSGSIDGYTFKTDTQGIGYYLDNVEN